MGGRWRGGMDTIVSKMVAAATISIPNENTARAFMRFVHIGKSDQLVTNFCPKRSNR